MSDDLPIYSETPLRTGLQFADLERLKGHDLRAAWQNATAGIARLEDARQVEEARTSIKDFSRVHILELHGHLFSHVPGAGKLRATSAAPRYRGQDCAPPQFIERSLDNLQGWLASESFQQIHPVEQCALVLSRIVDIWPFEFGNLTVALVAGNACLEKAGLAPFWIQPEQLPELEKAIAQSMTIDMQPLINAIYRTVKKEMEAHARR